MPKRDMWVTKYLADAEKLAEDMGSDKVKCGHFVLAALKASGASVLDNMVDVAEYEKRLKERWPQYYDNAMKQFDVVVPGKLSYTIHARNLKEARDVVVNTLEVREVK